MSIKEIGVLAGRRVLVTRTRENARGLVNALHAAGASVTVVPLISTVPIATPDEVAAAVSRLCQAPPPRWIAFTSAVAVRLLTGVLDSPGAAVKVAAVGAATAAALRRAGWPVDLQAAGAAGAAGLAEELERFRLAGTTVLLPRAEAAHRTLPERLVAAGATVLELPLYRTEMPEDAPRRLAVALKDGIDAVLLTSGSSARHLVSALRWRRLAPGTAIVCLGEQTAADAEAAGLDVDAVSATPDVAGLVDALARLLAARQPVR
jgi:uroporphyrinogen-III synthase